MTDNDELFRFLETQNQVYLNAFAQIKNGKKNAHWMCCVFSQIKNLVSSKKIALLLYQKLE